MSRERFDPRPYRGAGLTTTGSVSASAIASITPASAEPLFLLEALVVAAVGTAVEQLDCAIREVASALVMDTTFDLLAESDSSDVAAAVFAMDESTPAVYGDGVYGRDAQPSLLGWRYNGPPLPLKPGTAYAIHQYNTLTVVTVLLCSVRVGEAF